MSFESGMNQPPAEEGKSQESPEDPLQGMTAEDYKNKFRFLKEGADYPNLGNNREYLEKGTAAIVQGKTAGEWLDMADKHSRESDRVAYALYDKVIDGTLTAEQKDILADYLVDHFIVQYGVSDIRDSVIKYAPRKEELYKSPLFAEVQALAKEKAEAKFFKR